MKTIITTLALLASTLFVAAQNETKASAENGTTITVNVPVPSNDGKVYFALHNENTFMKEGLVNLASDINDGKASVTFKNVIPGTYAVMLFHDKNNNKRMDFEANGMPKEMYGVSNNVMNFGPPQWEDAKFEVTNEPIVLDIRM